MSRDEVEQSVERALEENWLPLLKTAGQWDEAKIQAELHDLVFIYHQVAEVYEHITNGKLSKPMYYADVIKAQFDDAINDAVKDAEARLRALEAGLEWYADRGNYWKSVPGQWHGSRWFDDGGSRARAALAGEAGNDGQ